MENGSVDFDIAVIRNKVFDGAVAEPDKWRGYFDIKHRRLQYDTIIKLVKRARRAYIKGKVAHPMIERCPLEI